MASCCCLSHVSNIQRLPCSSIYWEANWWRPATQVRKPGTVACLLSPRAGVKLLKTYYSSATAAIPCQSYYSSAAIPLRIWFRCQWTIWATNQHTPNLLRETQIWILAKNKYKQKTQKNRAKRAKERDGEGREGLQSSLLGVTLSIPRPHQSHAPILQAFKPQRNQNHTSQYHLCPQHHA